MLLTQIIALYQCVNRNIKTKLFWGWSNFSKKELSLINKKAKDGGINLWLPSSSH